MNAVDEGNLRSGQRKPRGQRQSGGVRVCPRWLPVREPIRRRMSDAGGQCEWEQTCQSARRCYNMCQDALARATPVTPSTSLHKSHLVVPAGGAVHSNSVTVEPAPSRRAEIFGLRHRSLSKGRGFDVGLSRRRQRSHTYNCPVRIAVRSIPYSAIHDRTCIITKDRWRCPVIFGRRCDS